MKKFFRYFLMTAFVAGFSSCSEIEDGTTDIDSWEDEYKPVEYTFNHPCMLHQQSDIDYVKSNLSRTPWKEAWDKLEANPYSNVERAANPTPLISRTNGNAECPNNATNFGRDCAGIYQLGLRYALTGDRVAAERAVANIKAWAENCNGIHHNGDTNQTLILFQVYQFANGMELLRDYNDYGNSDDFKKAADWLVEKFYPQANDFLARHNNTYDHYWLNWDLAAMTAILSMGILTDDQEKVNEAVAYFKTGIGAGRFEKAAPFVYDDPDGTGIKIAQCNESGRDQGHATLCASLMAGFCMMAYNIGEDLFAFDNHRMIAMAEYIAKYNVPLPGITTPLNEGDFAHPTTSMPYTAHIWCPDNNNKTGERTELGASGRGTKRPGWEIWRNYARKNNFKTVYIDEFADYLMPDEGAGIYDTNTGGYDQAGCSTLMFYREAAGE